MKYNFHEYITNYGKAIKFKNQDILKLNNKLGITAEWLPMY